MVETQTVPRRLVVRDGFVTAKDLAEAIGIDRSNLLKKLKKAKVPLDRRRTSESGGQFVVVLNRSDAVAFLEARDRESLGVGGQVEYIELEPSKP